MHDVKYYKALIFANALVPMAFLAYDGVEGRLGVNPIEFFLRTAGVLTLLFLLVTLLISPLRKLFGWNNLIKYRRMLGLFSFFYGCMHLVTYSIFDKGLNMPAIVGDVVQRPFIAVGMGAFLMLVPLSITSTNGMIKRLGGKRWARLHRLTYVAAALGVIHFWMIVKSDVFYPAMFGLTLVVLLGYRLYLSRKPKLRPIAASK